MALAILDVMLPDIDGFTLCGKILEKQTWTIIMLMVKDAETDRITGLTLGADDYATKTFRSLELAVRVKSQLRRYSYIKMQSRPCREYRTRRPGRHADSRRTGDRQKAYACTLNGQPLGLAIAREIVLLHGGSIQASSEHHTVTFAIRLPGEAS